MRQLPLNSDRISGAGHRNGTQTPWCPVMRWAFGKPLLEFHAIFWLKGLAPDPKGKRQTPFAFRGQSLMRPQSSRGLVLTPLINVG